MSYTWTAAVTDRVLADCVYGNPKGCLDAATLNRIENNIMYISELLAAEQYASMPTDAELAWDRTMHHLHQDFDRIKTRIITLRQSGIINSSTPSITLSTLPWSVSYTELNAMEQILLDIKEAFTGLTYMYRISGTFSLSNNYVLQTIRRG